MKRLERGVIIQLIAKNDAMKEFIRDYGENWIIEVPEDDEGKIQLVNPRLTFPLVIKAFGDDNFDIKP